MDRWLLTYSSQIMDNKTTQAVKVLLSTIKVMINVLKVEQLRSFQEERPWFYCTVRVIVREAKTKQNITVLCVSWGCWVWKMNYYMPFWWNQAIWKSCAIDALENMNKTYHHEFAKCYLEIQMELFCGLMKPKLTLWSWATAVWWKNVKLWNPDETRKNVKIDSIMGFYWGSGYCSRQPGCLQ